jgi:hypothetical protein
LKEYGIGSCFHESGNCQIRSRSVNHHHDEPVVNNDVPVISGLFHRTNHGENVDELHEKEFEGNDQCYQP